MSASNEGFGLAVPGLAVILTIISVFVLQTGPLETKRPPNPHLGDHAFSDQEAPARLWQDPFEAAERHLQSQQSSPKSTPPSPAGCPTSVAVGSVSDLIAKRWSRPWGEPVFDAWLDETRCWLSDAGMAWTARTDTGCAASGSHSSPAGDRIQILAALVDARPYAESAESRLRSRYAILSALNVSGYHPVDPTHVGYGQIVGDDGRAMLVPYERLQRKESTGDVETLMLLWLNSDAFHQAPIRGIRTIVDHVVPKVGVCTPIKVIGPGDSDGLVALIKEASVPDQAGSTSASFPTPRRLEFYVATATATDAGLIREAFGTNPVADPCVRLAMHGCRSVKHRLENSGLNLAYHRLIPDDGQLADRLRQELSERGLRQASERQSPPCQSTPQAATGIPGLNRLSEFNAGIRRLLEKPPLSDCDQPAPGQGGGEPCPVIERQSDSGPIPGKRDCRGRPRPNRLQHIVLVSEWDTTYGRSLPVAVGKALLDAQPGSRAISLTNVEELQGHPWLHHYSYMRGLDGNIPAGKGKDDESAAVPKSGAERAGSPSGSTAANERAEGQAQLDYLRRLTQALVGLKNKDGTSARIFAIGILGSDLYDKMLILQALRPAFPATLFFTTDLDARMLDGAYASYTRGLIVASGYGLRPGEYDAHASLGPLRTNYQTAIYHAARQALPSATAPRMAPVDGNTPYVVRLYEIGRNGANRLETCSRCHTQPPPKSGPSADNADDSVGSGLPGDVIDWILAAVFFAATVVGLLLAYQPRLRGFPRRHPLGFVALLALGVMLFLAVRFIRSATPLGCPLSASCLEPFSLTSGISGWMPIYLITASLVLSLLFIPLLIIGRRRVNSEIERRYLATPVTDPRPDAEVARTMGENLVVELQWLRARWLGLGRKVRRLGAWLSSVGARESTGQETEETEETLNRHPSLAEQVWKRHRRPAGYGWCWLRPLVLALLFFFFVFNLLPALGGSGGSSMLRGDELRGFSLNLRILSTLALSLLVFSYLEIAFGGRQLIAQLNQARPLWPAEVRRSYAANELKVDLCFVDRWISLRVVARYADMVVRAVVYPLVALLLLVAARLPWFDTGKLPIGIMVAYVVLAFYLLLSAWMVQRAARRMRDEMLDDYRGQLVELSLEETPSLVRQRQLEYLIGRLTTMRDFAFQHFSENPLVRAAVLPFGSLGLGLLEYLG